MSAFGLSFMWHENLLTIIEEFWWVNLGWMVSILVNYVTYISMEKNENNEYEIECSSNLVEL